MGHLQYVSGDLIFMERECISLASFLIGQALSKILWSLNLQVYQSSEGDKGVAGSLNRVKVTCNFHLLLSLAPVFAVQPTMRVEVAS